MPRLGGSLFEGVQFPIVFGDRFLSIAQDLYTGAPLVDIYRWDRDRGVLVVEMIQGRPLPGSPPITVVPTGKTGGVRLTVTGDDPAVVGYLSGGEDPTSLLISPQKLELVHGDQPVFELVAATIIGSPVGLRLEQGGGVAIGAGLPADFPQRRLFSGSTVVLSDLVGVPPVILNTEFEDCLLVGPALVAALGPLELADSMLPNGHFVWEFPAPEGEMVGVIGLAECAIRRCRLEGIGLAVPPGGREEVLARIRAS